MAIRVNPSIYDVAAKAGVSIGTVSNYLNNKMKAGSPTYEKIRQAILELDYVPHGNAGSKRSRQIGRIGVLSPFQMTPSFNLRLQGIAQVLVPANCEIILYSVTKKNMLNGYFHSIPLAKRLDGLILAALNISDTEMEYLHQSGLPVVSIEQPIPRFSSIECDNLYAGGLAAELFARKGYLPCGYIGEVDSDEPYQLNLRDQRLEGFRNALAALNHPLQDEHVLLGSGTMEDAERMAGEMLSRRNRPRAIFAYSDLMAFGILRAAHRLGLRVPEDVAILGFDDIEAANYIGMSTINQSLLESGRIAAELLMQKILEPSRPEQKINLIPSIVERETT